MATKGHWPSGRRRSEVDARLVAKVRRRLARAVRSPQSDICSLRACAESLGVATSTPGKWLHGQHWPLTEETARTILAWCDDPAGSLRAAMLAAPREIQDDAAAKYGVSFRQWRKLLRSEVDTRTFRRMVRAWRAAKREATQ